MAEIVSCEVRVHSTKDKKKLKNGTREYEYGTIVIRTPNLTKHIGKTVKVIVRTE